MNRYQTVLTSIVALCVLGACSSTKNLQIESRFPIPLIKKTPVNMGIYLDEPLREFTYQEVIEGKGEWNVPVGSVQPALFKNLATGMFEQFAFVESTTNAELDATLKPEIKDLQFSLPEQTRSDFYEVWINYRFQLFDTQGTAIADWALPAYGKASKKDFGNASSGVEAAAVAACRDAMAFFAINFSKEPQVKAWLQNRVASTAAVKGSNNSPSRQEPSS